MSSLLGLVVRLSRPASRIFRPVAFFSSASTLFDKTLLKSRELVKDMFREKGLPIINTSGRTFRSGDLKALNVSFKPAGSKNQIVPEFDVKDLLPEQYILPDIHLDELEKRSFDVRKIDGISDDVRTFILKLHWVAMNAWVTKETGETYTDTLVDDLLRIVGLNTFPLAIRKHQECRMFLGGLPYLEADPEFSIKMIDTAMIAADDKHLERWLVASDNLRQINKTTDQTMEQTMYAIRVISPYVTFYKTVIPALYFKELSEGLPQEQSVEILRWPGENIPIDGLNLGEPEGRREVLEILVKIRKHLQLNILI